ncbi:hypothetical protein CEE36_08405 [candidate division TA06 bacterium B3_TA06]|uniref:Uncharacterized protein n=1 Tax=candidate division TA06 bacterium B3_TA06 TaxID=2012487 RepID=A0A532V2V6_UNCT6|nr:MAG: hypothetical protein CEE36_08405 [candidate division TA06 bacterium B3_TA06]
MTPKKTQLTPLEELSFAPTDYPWDAQVAAKRLEEAFGWAALAAYSLWIDTSADSESFEAYPMLVVDLVDGEPCVVPAALKAASEALTDLDEETRSAVEDRLGALKKRLAQIEKASQESQTATTDAGTEEAEDAKSEAEPQSESQVDRGPRSDTKYSSGVKDERLAEAQRLVDRLAHQGRLLPAWGHKALVGFIAGLSQEKSLSQEGFEPISPLDFFIGLIESLPALVPLSEFASPQARVDNSFEALGHKIAKALK